MTTIDTPEVDSVEPAEVEIDVSSELRVHGHNFEYRVVSDIETGETTVATDFLVTLVPTSGTEVPVEVTDVQYVDSQLLRLVLPSGVAPGFYVVQVTGPHGRGAAT